MTAAFAQPAASGAPPEVPEQVPRDRWGRPKITMPDGSVVAYDRASTFAKVLDDGYELTRWSRRQVAAGMARRPDLVALAAADAADDRALDDVCKQAMAAVASSAAANTGTALHRFAELADTGHDISHAPAALRADLDAYATLAALHGLRTLAAELFVVVDGLGVAGTLDRLYAIGGKVFVGDLKTGRHAVRYPHAAAVQVACYAHGQPYAHPGRRGAPLADLGVDLSTGLLVHVPAGTGTAALYTLDLAAGWEAARLARAARDWQRTKPLAPVVAAGGAP